MPECRVIRYDETTKSVFFSRKAGSNVTPTPTPTETPTPTPTGGD